MEDGYLWVLDIWVTILFSVRCYYQSYWAILHILAYVGSCGPGRFYKRQKITSSSPLSIFALFRRIGFSTTWCILRLSELLQYDGPAFPWDLAIQQTTSPPQKASIIPFTSNTHFAARKQFQISWVIPQTKFLLGAEISTLEMLITVVTAR